MTRLVAVLLFSLFPLAAFPHDDDRTDELLRAIKKAKVIDLSHTWTQQSPIAGVNPPYTFALRDTHENTRPQFDGHLSFASDVMSWSGQHGAPSIDAIGHIGRDGKLFGGVDANASTSDPDGIGASGVGAHLAIDRFPKDLLINRGVMLDVASMVNGDLSPLPATFEITAKHLQDAAKRQRVTVKRGDTVFIRTGWGQHFAGDPNFYRGDFSPGPGLDAANWLIKQGARIVGNDTLTFEQRPPIVQTPQFQIFPVHMRLIADAGIYIIENLDLEGLAKARAYEFAVVVPPIKVLGGTGSAVRVFALVAD
ncbi:MAG TPA: cyclase family protein [Burkholderiales bacterium]